MDHTYDGLKDREISTGDKKRDVLWSPAEDGATSTNKEGEDMVDKFSEEEGTGISTVYEEGEEKAYASSEDAPSNFEDETMRQPSQNGVIDDLSKPPAGEVGLRLSQVKRLNDMLENGSHIIYDEYVDTTSKVQTRNDTYKADNDEDEHCLKQ